MKSLTNISPSKEIFTTQELSDRWGGLLTAGTLENWRAQKIGPPYVVLSSGTMKGRVVYRLADVKAYEKRHRIVPKGVKNGKS
jgi:hypothetical protein